MTETKTDQLHRQVNEELAKKGQDDALWCEFRRAQTIRYRDNPVSPYALACVVVVERRRAAAWAGLQFDGRGRSRLAT